MIDKAGIETKQETVCHMNIIKIEKKKKPLDYVHKMILLK